MYTRMNGRNRQYSLSHTEEGTAITGHPATFVKLEGGALRMQEVGDDQAVETDKEHETFKAHLKNYGVEWFWEDIQTPDSTEWMAEALKNETLTSVTDGSYMEHLHRNISGAGWIIQNRATGK